MRSVPLEVIYLVLLYWCTTNLGICETTKGSSSLQKQVKTGCTWRTLSIGKQFVQRCDIIALQMRTQCADPELGHIFCLTICSVEVCSESTQVCSPPLHLSSEKVLSHWLAVRGMDRPPLTHWWRVCLHNCTTGDLNLLQSVHREPDFQLTLKDGRIRDNDAATKWFHFAQHHRKIYVLLMMNSNNIWICPAWFIIKYLLKWHHHHHHHPLANVSMLTCKTKTGDMVFIPANIVVHDLYLCNMMHKYI